MYICIYVNMYMSIYVYMYSDGSRPVKLEHDLGKLNFHSPAVLISLGPITRVWATPGGLDLTRELSGSRCTKINGDKCREVVINGDC